MLYEALRFRPGDRVRYMAEENRGPDGEAGSVERIAGVRVYVRFDNPRVSPTGPLSCGAKSLVFLEDTSGWPEGQDAFAHGEAAPPQSS